MNDLISEGLAFIWSKLFSSVSLFLSLFVQKGPFQALGTLERMDREMMNLLPLIE